MHEDNSVYLVAFRAAGNHEKVFFAGLEIVFGLCMVGIVGVQVSRPSPAGGWSAVELGVVLQRPEGNLVGARGVVAFHPDIAVIAQIARRAVKPFPCPQFDTVDSGFRDCEPELEGRCCRTVVDRVSREFQEPVAFEPRIVRFQHPLAKRRFRVLDLHDHQAAGFLVRSRGGKRDGQAGYKQAAGDAGELLHCTLLRTGVEDNR